MFRLFLDYLAVSFLCTLAFMLIVWRKARIDPTPDDPPPLDPSIADEIAQIVNHRSYTPADQRYEDWRQVEHRQF